MKDLLTQLSCSAALKTPLSNGPEPLLETLEIPPSLGPAVPGRYPGVQSNWPDRSADQEDTTDWPTQRREHIVNQLLNRFDRLDSDIRGQFDSTNALARQNHAASSQALDSLQEGQQVVINNQHIMAKFQIDSTQVIGKLLADGQTAMNQNFCKIAETFAAGNANALPVGGGPTVARQLPVVPPVAVCPVCKHQFKQQGRWKSHMTHSLTKCSIGARIAYLNEIPTENRNPVDLQMLEGLLSMKDAHISEMQEISDLES